MAIQWSSLFRRSEQPNAPVVVKEEPIVESKPISKKRPVMAKLKTEPVKAEISSDLLNDVKPVDFSGDKQEQQAFSVKIEEQLANFGIKGQVVNVLVGPVIVGMKLL